jgi:putative methionine-R-sulfoxide reductase with GAF domain
MRRLTDLLWNALGGTGVSWCGFYLPAEGAKEMVLLACRPKPACSPIGLHGVCGKALLSRRAEVVEDVLLLGPAYVACDPRDRSEVVVPLLAADGTCTGVLDLDSHEARAFNRKDAEGLASVLRAAGLSA